MRSTRTGREQAVPDVVIEDGYGVRDLLGRVEGS